MSRPSRPPRTEKPATAFGEVIALERIARHAAGIDHIDGVAAPRMLRQRARDAVMDYRVAGLPPLIAKRFTDRERVLVAERASRLLLSSGFDATSTMRVPEVVGCHPESGVLLMRRAEGVPLATLIERPGEWLASLGEAGRWLARLHGLEAPAAPTLDPEAIVARLARRLARAEARRPEFAVLLRATQVDVAANRCVPPIEPRLTHGRYHPGHVFIADRIVTVIDLEGLAVADPARDLGEFLARVSMVARRTRQDERARDRAVAAFIAGYREGGGTIPASLTFHWSASMLGILAHLVEAGHPRLARRVEHCRFEIATIPGRAAAIRAKDAEAP